ncbi:MAG TPA: hypothetical protein VNB22_05615 [Pyrinomonadaceae bacterium]|nr:hypothetical protein [Pyrinomonadaceae bacterium]
MTLDINEQERDLLVEVLNAAHLSLIDEIHHTDGFEYKEMLREKLERLKELESKVGASLSSGKTI